MSKPALLHRRAEDVAAVAAGDEVATLETDHAIDEAGAVRVAQPQDLSLHGPDGDVGEPRAPCARGDDDRLGVDLVDGAHVHALAHVDTGGERRDDLAGVDGTVVGHVEGEADRRREGRLEAPRRAGQQPLDAQPVALAERVLAVERLGLVAVARDEQRPRGVQGDAELLGERRPCRGGREAVLEQLGVADLGLADGREHPRGLPRGAATGAVALEHDGAQAALLRAERDREAHHAGSDDGDVRCAGGGQSCSLRRHDPDQVVTVGASLRPLSPRGAPVSPCTLVRNLDDARLYFVSSATPGGRPLADVLAPALANGVDVFQLREKDAPDEQVLAAAGTAAALCREAGALFVLNDRPDLVGAAGADGVHVGQDDTPVAQARAIVGEDRVVGLSTHSIEQADAATGVDYFAVGPVHATPTKEGRPAIGLDPVRHAARTAGVPWFAIGGIDAATLPGRARRGRTPGRRRPRDRRGARPRARRPHAEGDARWGSAVVSAAARASRCGRATRARRRATRRSARASSRSGPASGRAPSPSPRSSPRCWRSRTSR